MRALLQKFSKIEKINPIEETSRLTDLSIAEMLSFYDERYSEYKTYYDVILTV